MIIDGAHRQYQSACGPGSFELRLGFSPEKADVAAAPSRGPFSRWGRRQHDPGGRLSALASWGHTLEIIQGVYFAVTGLWPLVHLPSFLAVTGPKVDLWLVRTVGTLVLAMGAALLVAGLEREAGVSWLLLGWGSALGLAVIDVWYVLRGRIRRIYLADAVVELALATAWVVWAA